MKNDIPIIQCAVCQRPVEEISWHDDPSTPNYERVFRVKCHGDYETTRLSPYDMADWTITGGVAFATKRLAREEAR